MKKLDKIKKSSLDHRSTKRNRELSLKQEFELKLGYGVKIIQW